MKTDCEFIEGIYEKAKNYDSLNAFEDVIVFDELPRQNRAKLQLVACLTIVLLTGINYTSSNFNQLEIADSTPIQINGELNGIDENYNTMARSLEPVVGMSLGEGLYYNPIDEAEVLCTAQVLVVEDSIYDLERQIATTKVKLKLNETIKGEINEEFELLVTGGLDYGTVFNLDEVVLLCLQSFYYDTSLYILTGDALGKFSLIENDLFINDMGECYDIQNLKLYFDN